MGSDRFPYRWVLEVRKSTTADADLSPVSVYSPRVSQGGRTTHYAEEVLTLDAVSLRDLPRRLRALANHYENVKGTTESDDAVVLVGRRRALYVAEEELPSRTEKQQKVAVDLSVTSGSPTLSFSPNAGRWSFPTPTVEEVAQAETHPRSVSSKTKVKKRRASSVYQGMNPTASRFFIPRIDPTLHRFHRPARVGVVITTPKVAAVMVWVEAETCLHELTLLARLAGSEARIAAYGADSGIPWTWTGAEALRRELEAA